MRLPIKQGELIIIVLTKQIQIVCTFMKNSGLTWLIMDSLVNLLAWVNKITVNSGSFFWYLTAKMKYCLLIDDFGVFSAKRTFKGFSEVHKMIKLDEFIYLLERKTFSGRFSVDWTKTIEGIKILHRKQDCLDCDNGKNCIDCAIKPKMNCFYCEMKGTCKACLDPIPQKETYSYDNNLLKRKPAIETYQTLPYYECEYKPKQNIIDFESDREILMKNVYKMVMKKRFERIYYMMKCGLYMKNDYLPENKKIFIYGFKHIKTDKIDIYVLFGCESDENCEIYKLLKFWSSKCIIKEIEMRNFKTTGWPFMILVKRNNFFKIQSSVCGQK